MAVRLTAIVTLLIALPAFAAEPAGGERAKHWSFQPIVRTPLPNVTHRDWCRNPIDLFILARLEKEGFAPSREADRTTLARRLYLDLLGLPPKPEEIDAFVADQNPDAYERLVDRLLASPRYGERWGRQWLDVARYADSNGYSIDSARSIWPHRDWVIKSLNRDMPFDRFVIEQIAGDLLPGATQDQIVATGFHRNTPINEEGGIDLEQFRVDSIYDRLNTTGAALLGLTVGCAQCHDHKFDPLKQREYYELFAFLNNDDEPTLELGTPQQSALKKKIRAERAKLEKEFKRLDRFNDDTVEAWQGKLTPQERASLPPQIEHILTIAPNGRDEKQRETVLRYVRNLDKTRHVVGALMPTPFASLPHLFLLQIRQRIEKRLAELKAAEPYVRTTLVLRQRAKPRQTNVHIGGDFTRKGAPVEASTPQWLGVNRSQGKTRLDFARWLVDPKNPLTPRVTVNRLWQGHFGTGIVETENDFGTKGSPPSHPELLDWLASEFIAPTADPSASPWSLKYIHRLIVCSATYRQSSSIADVNQASNPKSEIRNPKSTDPSNRLLWRMNRVRLDAEMVRDSALAASGLLNEKLGGLSVYPPQPDGVFRLTQVPRTWKASIGPDRYRRGLYTFIWRSAPHPALAAFDAPDGATTCTRRNRSNTPLQALTLLNDQAFVEMSKALAQRVLSEPATSDRDRLTRAFRLCLGRAPSDRELQRVDRLLTDLGRDQGAWESVARALLNLDEFITRE
jgi:hypothetical protein